MLLNADMGDTKIRNLWTSFMNAPPTQENKARANEIVRLANDLDRSKMDNEGLRRDNGKLSDEVRALKMELDALKKRFHELDSENRRVDVRFYHFTVGKLQYVT